MTVTVREVLKADLVLVGVQLLQSATEIQKFRDSVGGTVSVGSGMATDAATGAALAITGVALQRERIIVSCLSERTLVVKEFPSLDDPRSDWSRFAQVVTCAIEATDDVNKNPRSFGYNFGFVFDMVSEESAPNFLSRRTLTDRPAREPSMGIDRWRRFDDVWRRFQTLDLQPSPSTSW